MGLDYGKEELQLKNRIRDLADKSFKQNVFTFTGFLGLSDQDIFWQVAGDIKFTKYELWGGLDTA